MANLWGTTSRKHIYLFIYLLLLYLLYNCI